MARGSADNRYCNVQVRTWDDPDFCELSAPAPCAQTLWLYLLSGPYTTRVPGVVFGGRAAMAEALGWPQEAFDRCFAEIEGKGMAVADWRARVIYLPKSFKQSANQPQSPSVCVYWRKVINDLPECELVSRIDRDLRKMLGELGESFLKSYSLGRRSDKRPEPEEVSVPQAVQQQLPLTAPQAVQQSDPHTRARPREVPEGVGLDPDLDLASGKSDARARVDGGRLLRAWKSAGFPGMPAMAPLLDALNALPEEQLAGKDVEARFCAAAAKYVAAYLEHKNAKIPPDPARIADPKHFGNIVEVMLGRFDVGKLANGRGPPRRALSTSVNDESREERRKLF